MINVLFVCLGNICRSPTAEAVFRAHVHRAGLADKIGIDSAATHDYQIGNPPDRRAQAVARRRGVIMDGLCARRCCADDFRRFDYILAMDRSNYADLSAIRPADSRARLALFLDFADDIANSDVPDPYNADMAAFEQMFELVDLGAQGLLSHLRAALV